MRTSRVIRETAKITNSISHADFVPHRQTRSFAASLQSFTYNGDVPVQKVEKEEPLSADDSSLSSLGNGSTFDIEDAPFEEPSARKRKRGFDSPSTAVTSISTVTSTRTSPRKASVQEEHGTVSKGGKARKAKRQPAWRIFNEAGEEKVEPPANWEEVYDAVREMRKERLAPVDTMGCETLADERVTPRDKRFQTLIALMLSSQTKDTTNAIAMRKLQTELPSPGLTLENILEVDPVKLNEMIFVVGFHNNKTRYIKATALILRDQYDSDIPDTIEGLMSLPGVGPKMGYLCLSAAWGKTEGIGVDVHVHRITNLWGWHKPKTQNPEATRMSLEAWLPRERWHEINHLLVGFGQTVCLPMGRKCGECTLSERGLCPSAVVEKNTKVVKRVKREMERDGSGVREEVDVVVKEEDVLADDEGRSRILS